MDDAVRGYIDAIPSEQRALFDRLHRLIVEVHPDAEVTIAYKMPTFTVGPHRLYVGAWEKWVSLYGWQRDHDAGFTARRPELANDKGTIRLRPADAEAIPDDELRDLVRAALED